MTMPDEWVNEIGFSNYGHTNKYLKYTAYSTEKLPQ
jgi:hypothetical protein